ALAELLEGVEHAPGDLVGPGEDRVDPGLPLEEEARGAAPPRLGPGAVEDPIAGQLEAGRGERLGDAEGAVRRGAVGGVARDVGDPPSADRDEVLDGEPGAPDVVR